MVTLDHIAPLAHATPAGRTAGGRWRFARPSLGVCVSVVMHAGAAGAVLLLMRPVAELAFGAPALQRIEVAVAFEATKPPPAPTPLPQALPVPLLPPEPEPPPPEPITAQPTRMKLPEPPPIVADTPVEQPLPEQPEAEVQLAQRPPEPPKKVVEVKPIERPVAKPVKRKPKPKPVAKPAPKAEPAPPQPVAQSAPEPAPERQEQAAAPSTPAPTEASKPSVDRVAAPVPDAGPEVVMDPDYRDPPQPPIYPPRSVSLGQQGRVVIRAAIDHDGVPESVVVWQSSGFPLLDTAAVTAVKRWRFMPARRGGMAVAAWVQVPVNFRLR